MTTDRDPLTVALAAALAPVIRATVAEALAEHEPAERPPALVDRRRRARDLGVSPATVRRLEAGGPPVVRVADSPRFEVAAVLGWLRARTEGDHE
jgi:hypothetical protein